MEYTEFRRHLGKAGLTINLFASYLGVKPSSVSNYAKQGKVPRVYALLAILMGDAVDRKIDILDLFNRYHMHPVVNQDFSDSNVHQMEMFRSTQKSNTTKSI